MAVLPGWASISKLWIKCLFKNIYKWEKDISIDLLNEVCLTRMSSAWGQGQFEVIFLWF